MGMTEKNRLDEVFDIENPIVRWMCIVWILAIAIITIILLTPIWLMSKVLQGLDSLWMKLFNRQHK